MNDLVPAFEVALADNNFKAVKEIWSDLVNQEDTNLKTLLNLAEKVKVKNDPKKAASLLSILLEKLVNEDQLKDSYSVARTISGYNPNDKKLFNTLIEIIPKVFDDLDEIETIVGQARDKFDGKTQDLLKYLDTFIAFKPGDFVFHASGWGFGKVKKILPTDLAMTVDFEEGSKKNHKFLLKAASKMLEKLGSDHYLVWKKTKLEELRELCKKDPVEVVKMILDSEKIELSQKDIKARIVPDVLENSEWNKFLQKLKKEAQTDAHLQISSGGNPKYTVTEEAKLYEDVTLKKFKRAQGWQEKLVLGYEAYTDTVEYKHDPAFLEEIGDYFTKLIEQNVESKGTAIVGAVMILTEIHANFEQLQVKIPHAIEECFSEDEDVVQMLDTIAKLQIPQFQKKLFKNLKTWFEKKWDDILYNCFFTVSQTLWEESLKVCDKDSKFEIFEKAGAELILNYDKYPENFIWYVKQVFAKAKKNDKLAGEVYHLFDLLLNLAFRLHHSQLRGDKAAKANLTKLKNLVADPKLSLLKFLLGHIKEAEADHLYNHINRTDVLGEIAKTKLKSEIKNSFRQFKQKSITRAMPKIDESKVYITPEGLRKLNAEIQRIEKDEIPAIQKAIGAALELGDISENAELDAARERDVQTKQRLSELREELKNHHILEAENISTATVSIGTKIMFTDVESGDDEFLTIVGCTWDIDLENRVVSYNSPLARSMLGARIGDTIPVPGKAGIRKIKINKIDVGIS